jgi:TonB family protein
MREKVQGLVFLEAVITVEGTIGDVRVVYGLHPELDDEAIKAVKQWLLEPPMKGSNPVAVIAPIEVSFRLK